MLINVFLLATLSCTLFQLYNAKIHNAKIHNAKIHNAKIHNTNIHNVKINNANKLSSKHNYIQPPSANIANKFKKILFNKYKPLAYEMSNEFHLKYSQLSRYDLEQCAFIGLFEAMQNYEPRYPFYSYARIYILQELYKTRTPFNIEFAS